MDVPLYTLLYPISNDKSNKILYANHLMTFCCQFYKYIGYNQTGINLHLNKNKSISYFEFYEQKKFEQISCLILQCLTQQSVGIRPWQWHE